MKTIKDTCYKGTRILIGNEKRNIINKMCDYLIEKGFQEISIPVIQLQETFVNKVGELTKYTGRVRLFSLMVYLFEELTGWLEPHLLIRVCKEYFKFIQLNK